MTTLDDLFTRPVNTLPDPRLRVWNARKAAGAELTLDVPPPLLMFGQSQRRMILQGTENGNPLPHEEMLWDDDLNDGLIQMGVKAEGREQEAERFALGLRAAMRKPGREFGDGYFNSVLVDFLKESELIQFPEISEVLEHTTTIDPSRKGKHYELCRDMIEDAISGRARELTGSLGYAPEEAKQILVAALARYLDDRFSVSRRKQLGMF